MKNWVLASSFVILPPLAFGLLAMFWSNVVVWIISILMLFGWIALLIKCVKNNFDSIEDDDDYDIWNDWD